MRMIAKNKPFNVFIVMATIAWTIGIAGILTPLFPANAAVTVATENRIPTSWMVSGGMMQVVAGLKITASASEQLQSIKVRFEDIGTSGATPATMLVAFNDAGAGGANDSQGLCVYKDNNSNGGFEPGGSIDTILAWENKPTWTDNGNGTYDTTLDITNQALPTSYATGYNYFVHMKMAAQPPAGKSFRLTFLTGAGGTVVTSGTSPSITAFSTGALTSMGDGAGGWIQPPHIARLVYANYKQLTVMFDKNMSSATTNCASAETCAVKYTLHTKDASDTETIVSAALDNTELTKLVLNAHADARISVSTEDWIQITTDPSNAPKSAVDPMPVSSNFNVYPTLSSTSLVISEVKLAGTNTTDEFIEIYSRGNMNLNNYTIKAFVGGVYTTLATLGNVNLASGKYYLLANTANNYHQNVNGANMIADATFTGVDLAAGDTIFFLNAFGEVIDMVGLGANARVYEGSPFIGTMTAGKSAERKALASATATTMDVGGANVIGGNGYDSDINSWDFIVRTTADPQNLAATAETPGGGGVNTAPTIIHMPIINSTVSNELKIPAKINDMQEAFSNLTTKLCYKASNTSWPESPTCVTGQMMMDVVFTIPASAVTSAGIDYYIYATDSVPATSVACFNPSATSIATAQSSPYHITVSTSSGSRSVSGTVYQSDCSTPIANATVYLEGTGFSAISNNSGVFTINNVSDGVYNLKTTSGGYLDGQIWGVSVNSNNPVSSGWVSCLTAGSAGLGGDLDAPGVMWSAPGAGMMGAPADIVIDKGPILIGLDKAIDSTTATCANCDAASANIKFKRMSGGSMVNLTGYNIGLDTGSGVTFHSITRSFGGSATMPVIVLEQEALLTNGTQYIVEITPAVKDTAGNAISGSRIGGGHEFMFTVGASDMKDFGGGAGFVFTQTENSYMTGGATFWNNMKTDTGYLDMSTNYNTATGNWTGGSINPPYILGAIPAPGAWNISKNSDIVLSFSEGMDSSSVNRGTFELYSVTNNVETNVTQTLIDSVSLSSDKEQVTMDVVSGGLVASTHYRIKVKNAARSSAGITIGNPNDPSAAFFVSDFDTGTGTDSSAPAITGSWPDNAATNVSNIGFIDIGLDEVITTVNSSTVKLMSGATNVPSTVEFDPMAKSIRIYPTVGLMAGATYTVQLIGGATGINDLAGNDFLTTTRTFTMSTTVDTNKPRVEFSNCDDYSCAITFNKAMNAASATDTNRWTSSVINPANYSITQGAEGTTPYIIPNAASFTWDNKVNTVKISGLALSGKYNFVVANVKDLSSNPMDTDVDTASGNVLSSAKTQGFVGPGGGGMMGAPMAGGATMTGPTGFGGFTAMDKGSGMAAGVFPMNSMAGATTTYIIDFPIAPSGGTSNRLDNGATIKITFPQGFDISSVIPDPYNPNKNDLNMMGPSTVALKTSGVTDDGSSAATKGGAANDGVTVSGQTVTLYLSVLDGGVAGNTGDPDFLHLEIKGIINSKIPKDFNTEGYSIDMKSYKAAGTLVESKTSMPFFTAAAGTNNITANITAAEGNGTFSLMMGSPMSGPQDATVTITNGTGAQTWSNLPNGCYNLFTEPTITLGANNKYSGQMNPEPLCLPGSGANWNAGTSTLTKALTFVKYGAGNSTSLNVKVSGTFSASGEDVDISAGGPAGYNVETKTLTGAVTNNSTTLYLPANGSYMIGVYPAMPKGPKMGPPQMPDWMPPMSVNIEVSGVGGTPVIKRMDTGAVITELSFTINTANKQILGRVVSAQTTLSANYTANATTLSLTSAGGFLANDTIVLYDGTNTATGKISSMSGTTVTLLAGISQGFSTGAKVYNVMANAEVFANQPMGFGGAGSHTQSKADGSFVLKISMNGVYDLGVFKPGYGEAPSRTVSVANNNAGTVDNNSTADISANNALVTTAAPLIVRIGRPDYTISGKISNSSGSALQYAHVQAKEATSYQMVHTSTDTDGNYVIGVGAGTWTITADMPSGIDTCGVITKTVLVTDASKDNQNIQPASITCYTISGTVTLGGTAQANIPVGVETWDTTNDRPSGGYHRNEMTDSSGAYSIKVGAGTYRVSIWTPDYGEIGQSATVTIQNVTSDISYDATQVKTLTLAFTGGTSSMRGFVEAKGTTGTARRGMPIVDLSANKTMSLPSGTYKILVFVDGLGDFSPASNVDLSSNQTVTINLSGQTLYTVSGNVLDALNSAIANAGIIVTETTTGLTERATTDSNGDYSLSVKAGTYKIKAEQQDYDTPAKAEVTVSANLDYDFDANLTGEGVAVNNPLQAKTAEISGTIYKSDGTTLADNGIVFASTSDGKYVKTAIQKDGTYTLPVSDGTWTVKADASLHAPTTMSSAIVVAGADQAGKNATLTADATDIKKADTITMTPSVGGTVDDSDNTGVEMNFGAAVLGRDSNPGSVIVEEVDAPTTDSFTMVGNLVDITAKDSEDGDINQLGGDGAEVVFHYTNAEMTAAGVTTESALKLVYFDETLGAPVPFDNQVIDTAANTITGYITHFTTVGIGSPPITISAPPASPGGGAGALLDTTAPVISNIAVSAKDTEATITWTTNESSLSWLLYGSTSSYGKEEKTGAYAYSHSVKLTGLLPATIYHYQVKSKDTASNVGAGVGKTFITLTTVEATKKVADEAAKTVVTTPIAETIVNATPTLPTATIRDLAKEAASIVEFNKIMKKVPASSAEWLVVTFLTYGSSDATKALTMAERSALVVKFKKANSNKLPKTDADWLAVAKFAQPAIKVTTITPPATTITEKAGAPVITIVNAAPTLPIASIRSLAKEILSITEFGKIMRKMPAKSSEWLVVTFLTYGSSDATKALAIKDRSGLLADFKEIYGKLPVTDADWQNLAKIAQNATPAKVASKETQAAKDFKKIFKRVVKFTNATEEKFVHMVTYRLRITERDLNKEKVGLAKYRSVYKAWPKTSKDWAIVRALSYLDIK
ncbi:MAG: carboxypeptidase regulatory-like domain-containing protein [Candidatus Falkowbacteria bacterium]